MNQANGRIPRIVWISRHDPLPSQLKELYRLFGPFELIRYPNPFNSVAEIISWYRREGGDEMVIVAPLSVIAELCRRGIKPLFARMEEVLPSDPRRELTYNGRCYRFVGFERIKELRMVTEPLKPQGGNNAH